MEGTSLIRFAGLAAMASGVVYAASGLMTLPMVPGVSGITTFVEGSLFALLFVGAMASIAGLHVLHKDLPPGRYGPLGVLTSVMAFTGMGLLLVGGSAIFVALLLVTGGLVAMAVVIVGAGVVPRWCGVALIVGNPALVLLGEDWMSTLVGAAWAAVGCVVFQMGASRSELNPRSCGKSTEGQER